METETITNIDTERNVRKNFEQSLAMQPENKYATTLAARWIDTPVGSMLAAADDRHLHLLAFIELSFMERKADLVQQQLDAGLKFGDNAVLASIDDEIRRYFTGMTRDFDTPILLKGTSFQLSVWDELRKIPFGHTVTYAELAARIGKPAAFRAVAQANAQNPVAIVVPDHRVVNSDGRVGGNAARLDRKKWLIDFEQAIATEE
jgi:O-6-methylguanine DNA methyltransferase